MYISLWQRETNSDVINKERYFLIFLDPGCFVLFYSFALLQLLLLLFRWAPGNLPFDSLCVVCEEPAGDGPGIKDFRCIWCQRTVHTECQQTAQVESEPLWCQQSTLVGSQLSCCQLSAGVQSQEFFCVKCTEVIVLSTSIFIGRNSEKAKNWKKCFEFFIDGAFSRFFESFWPKNCHYSVIKRDNLTIPTAMSS